ncbi:MAG: pilus assembly PilX N-terminal domain-containing protein [Eubacteriales bacterium]
MLSFGNLISSIRKSIKNQKGSTLMTVLIIMLIFAVIGSAVLITTANNLRIAQRVSEYEDIYYMAEANAQYALTFVKEEIIEYYANNLNLDENDSIKYNKNIKDFYPTIVTNVTKDNGYQSFNPIDFTDQGVTSTINISVDESTPLPTGGYGDVGNPVKFIIESIAETETSRRVVTAVLVVDDPDVEWKMTSGPPMTDMRMLIGNEIVLTDDWNAGEYNSIFCRGSALIAYYFVDQFLEDHLEYLGTYTYDFSNAVPAMLEWDLEYDKFPPTKAFETFESLFEASTPGTTTYNETAYWQNYTVNYNITGYAPAFYDNKDILDTNTKSTDVDYYFTQSTQYDYRPTTRYEGTTADQVTVYATGNLSLTGTKNLKNCYIFAEGYVNIDITGYIENTIIISLKSVTVDCQNIFNSDGKHYMIKGNDDVTIRLDEGAVMKNVVGVSKYGMFTIGIDNGSPSDKKITMITSYIYTNSENTNGKGMVVLENVYAKGSYVNAGKDLVLKNCSGFRSGFYAHGVPDDQCDSYYERKYNLYLGTQVSYDTQLDYNRYMQYQVDRDYFRRWMRGIIMISQVPPIDNSVSYEYENTFLNCDFTTDQSIYMCDPRFRLNNNSQLITTDRCRLLAKREVLLEDVYMNTCYVYAGIDGYEDEQDYFYVWGTWKLYAVRGIYMRMDRTHNELRDTVFYSKGRMMYSQHTPEEYGYPITEDGKVRVYKSFFYSVKNFEYNGTSTSEGLDTTVMRNNSDLCNNMIIMTEGNLGPHEFSPSIANDVLFIGGTINEDPETNSSQALVELFGGPKELDGGTFLVQYETLYNNYFEQRLNEDQVLTESPSFGDVFVFEDIYEKKEAEMEGS